MCVHRCIVRNLLSKVKKNFSPLDVQKKSERLLSKVRCGMIIAPRVGGEGGGRDVCVRDELNQTLVEKHDTGGGHKQKIDKNAAPSGNRTRVICVLQ